MSKKHIVFTSIMIFFLLFTTTSVTYGDNSALVNDGGGGVHNPNKLANSLHIHMGEDGLIRLTRGETDNMAAWRVLIREYRKFVVGFAGFGAVTMVLLFIKYFIKLGAVAGNPQARSEAIKGLWVTGIATALLGSVAIITSLFYTALK